MIEETQPVYVYQAWPAWRYGPDGEAEIFNSEEEVPPGWGTDMNRDAEQVSAEPAKRGPGRPAKVAEPAEEQF